MANKKPRSKTSRSRSASRSRATSKTRQVSKSRNVSRSPSRKSVTVRKSRTPSSEPKAPRRPSPSSSSEESPKVIVTRRRRSPSASRRGTRSSVRVIEKLESSVLGSQLELSPTRCPPKPAGFFTKAACGICCSAKSLAGFVFSQAALNVAIATFAPLFVFWCCLLVVSPSSAAPLAKVSSPYGRAISFGGVAWPYDWRSLNPWVILGVFIFHELSIALNYLIPFGQKTNVVAGGRRFEHKANGLYVLLVFSIALGLFQTKGLEYAKGYSIAHLIDHLPSIFVGAWILAFCVALFTFWRSRNLRSSSTTAAKITGNHLVDFVEGREIRPQFMGFDMKTVVFYPSMVGLCILQASICLRQFETHGKLSPGLFTAVLLHAIVMLDFFVFEPTLLQTFGAVYAGFGYRRSVALYTVAPFMRSLAVLFLGYNFTAGYPYAKLYSCDGLLMGSAVLLTIIGLWIRRISMNQKFLFRTDPHHPVFEEMDSVPTSTGKRILAGGWWGRCRHPNYLGDWIMMVGLTLPAGFTSIVPWITPLVFAIVLIVHSYHVESRCVQKYGAAWNKYTGVVRARFIPRVY